MVGKKRVCRMLYWVYLNIISLFAPKWYKVAYRSKENGYEIRESAEISWVQINDKELYGTYIETLCRGCLKND